MHGQPTVFVGGPIQHALQTDGGFDSRLGTLIQKVLQEVEDFGCEVLSAHRYEGFGTRSLDLQSDAVAARDFAWMERCDLFLAVLGLDVNANAVRSDGTCIELGWASALRKPVVIIRSQRHFCSHLVDGLGAVTPTIMLDCDDVVAKAGIVSSALERVLRKRRRDSPPNTAGGVQRRLRF